MDSAWKKPFKQLNADSISDDLKRRQAQLFQRTMLVLIAGCLLSLPVVLLIPASRGAQILLGAAQASVVVIGLLAVQLLSRGQLERAVLIGSLGLQVALAIVISVIGIRNAEAALFAFALPLVLVGLLASRRELIVTALTSIVLVITLIVIEPAFAGADSNVRISDYPIPLIGLTFTVVLIVIGVILDRYGEALRQSVGDLQQEYERRRQLEARLEAGQRLESIGRLAGGVAHDFNNLLTVVIANAELSIEDPRLDTDLRESLEEIRSSAVRAARLTRQLLAFSRRQVLETKVIDLNELLRNIEGLLRRLLSADIELQLALSPGLWPVLADDGQIEQVIVNLVVNARDAMPQGGRLQIRSSSVCLDATPGDGTLPAGDYVLIEVQDTGIGMDETLRTRIFEPFFTTKDAERGTGLGLATSYGIIKQHGGHIEVLSTPGKGSNFQIYLPRSHQTPETLQQRVPGVVQPGGNERILVVDDNAAVRRVALAVLQRLGYTVFEAGNSSDARALLESGVLGSLDVLLTDLVMPQGSGVELANWFREQCPDLRVIYMTGYADSALQRAGSLDPAIPLVHKPFTAEQLAVCVRQCLDDRRRGIR